MRSSRDERLPFYTAQAQVVTEPDARRREALQEGVDAVTSRVIRDLLAGYLGRADELQRLSYLRLRTHQRLDEVR